MDEEMFQELLRLVTPLIQKQDTNMRQAISVQDRLVATLRYVATGRSLQDLKFSTLISPQAMGLIIPETCKALYTVLKNDYFKFPTSAEEWRAIAEEFQDQWNFPNCGGAIDGKHVRITPPSNSGSLYFNYKGYFSIVLMAIVNADYEFIYIDVGKNGRASDGGCLKDTIFYERLLSNQLHLPEAESCKNGMNFVFVADEAFALHEHILKPFPQRSLTHEKRIFNYRLSRARRVVKNAFGILSRRFRIFNSAIDLRVDKITWVVNGCCALHNYLRRKKLQSRPQPVAVPGGKSRNTGSLMWDGVETPAGHTTQSSNAKKVREEYMAYFNGVGAVDWQEDEM
ncbi:uncharacterized protein LOC134956748 [Pseudophryne corroboree]|uniref:uncharacterized protein LOC134956748 n=1 Tax=Pseudophryne corroboree TaxID=495146 RepID=UPI003081BB3D